MALELAPTQEVAQTAEKSAAKPLRLPAFNRGISNTDRMFFTEQLALLIETGMPVHQALIVLRDQVGNAALADVIGEVNEMLAAGKSLSYALEQHPEVFSTTYVNLVAASEGGGFMHEVLTQLLEMEEKREELRSTLVSAFTYPAFLVVFSILVVIFVLVFVFPKFGALFLAIEDELPATTVVLLAASDFMREQWMLLLGILTGIGFFLGRWFASDGGRAFVDRAKLGTPFISGIFIQLYLVQSLRVLSLSLRNGVPIVESLHACRDVVDNGIFREFLRAVETRVMQGGKIGEGFTDSQIVPDLAKQMISVGEEAGNLGIVADRMAQFYQRELNKKLDRLAKIIEPVMLLVMGVVVGVIVSSLILPIFKLS
ncbi:MAG: type II secretion system F family protein, partial [Gammaproteobacteria bacterium]|nr:type II secretion system F family protein [Gammaproteobacteria bacterium]